MSNETNHADGREGRDFLKKAVIVFAIVEALVLVPSIIYIVLR